MEGRNFHLQIKFFTHKTAVEQPRWSKACSSTEQKDHAVRLLLSLLIWWALLCNWGTYSGTWLCLSLPCWKGIEAAPGHGGTLTSNDCSSFFKSPDSTPPPLDWSTFLFLLECKHFRILVFLKQDLIYPGVIHLSSARVIGVLVTATATLSSLCKLGS